MIQTLGYLFYYSITFRIFLMREKKKQQHIGLKVLI